MATQKNSITIALALIVVLAVAAVWWFLGINKQPSTGLSATSSASYVEGVHYRSLKSPLVADGIGDEKISVQEFFWYGCPHCRSFEPEVRKWLSSAPEDIAFQQIPVAWNDATRLHAALFYVAEQAENVEPLHDKLFDKIIELRPERNLASQLEQISPLFADHGLDAGSIKGMTESKEVRTAIERSENLMRQAEVSSTPTVLVGGQWVVLNNEDVAKVGSFSVVDFLVQKARDAR